MVSFYLSMLEDANDQLTFTEIYNNYRNLMAYIIKDILNDHSVVEDVLHQSFIKIIENFSTVKELSSIKQKSYITRTTKSCTFDFLKTAGRYIPVPDEDLRERLLSNVSVDDEVINKISLEELVALIEKLPEIYADVLVPSYVLDLSDKQIAKMLNISLDAVRKRKERGKRELYLMLTEGENDDEK